MFSPITLNLSQLVGDVQLAGVAQGNILIRGASKWNNLATGTAGYGLVSGGAGANPSWQPVVLANGAAGGQTIIGGTGASDNLTLLSTSNATKGQVRFGTTAAWDETTGSFNVGSLVPLSNVRLYVNTGADAYKGIVVRANSGSQSANLFEVQDSSGNNYFETRSAASSGRSLATVRTALTNTNFSALTLSHVTSGTPAASFGVNLAYALQDDTGVVQNSGVMISSWATAVSASRKGRLSFHVYDAASVREGIRIDSDGSGAYVGINGVVDTVARLRVSGPCYITQSLGVGIAATAFDNPGAEYTAQVSRTFTETTNASIKANLYSTANWTHTEGGTTQQFVFAHQNILNVGATTTTNNTGYFRCGQYETYLRSNSTATEVTGFRVTAGTYNGGSDTTGTIASCYGAYISGIKTTSSTITTGYGVYVTAIAATTAYGVNVSTVTGSGASAFGVYIGAVTGATNNYDLYCADAAALNYFAGTVGVGATPLTATRLYVNTGADATKGVVIRANSGTQSANLFETQTSGAAVLSSIDPSGIQTMNLRDAATTTDVNALIIDHFSSGTPGTGYGTGIKFQLQSSTTVSRDAGRICGVWATATDASRKARLVFLVSDNTTEREGLRIETDGTNALVSLTATSPPTAHLFSSGLAQPSTVGTATGTAATAEIAFTGGSGGNTNIATTGTGGAGGAMTFTTGAGGAATAATTASTGGAGGLLTLQGGTGASASVAGAGTNTGGVGGAITITGGTGGAASNGGTNVGANGGAVTVSGGTAGIGTTTSGTGGLATFRGGAAAATAGSNGGNVLINGRDGSTTGSGGSGGAVTILGGNAGGDDTVSRTGGSFTFTAGSSKGSGAGGGISLSGGAGGPGTGTSGATGGGFGISCGAGGSSLSTGSATGGNAGTFVINAIAGGTANNATTACTGGVGSQFTVTCGTGGAATAATSGTNTGGAGGAVNITAGTGGAANTGVTNNGGAGGGVNVFGGTGGIGTTASGAGGNVNFRAGTAAAAAGASPGTTSILGGIASTTGSGGAGGNVVITASNAGGDNTVNRGGGAITLTGGNSIGSSAGGAITLTCGAGGVGTGTTGGVGGQLTFNAGLGGDGSVTDGAGGAIVFQTADTLTRFTRLTITANGASQFVGGATPTGNTAVQINTGADANVGLTIIANSATQTAELIRVRTSASVTLWQVAASGLESTWLRDAGTNNTPTIAQFIHGTSGTAAAGFGSSISLEAFSDSGAQRAQMSLTSSWVVATDGSRTSRGIINAHDATTSRECIRVETSGTAAMIGVLGATAIARYSTTGTTTGFTAGAGTNVTDQSTFTGNTGATAYTIGDIVRALKQYGWLTS